MVTVSQTLGGMPPWRRQRGVAAIFAAVAIFAAITAFGLVYDMGLIYSAQRDLQRVANVAALDAAMAAGGCADVPIVDPQAVAQAQAAQSVLRNAGSDGTQWLSDGSVTIGSLETVAGIRSLRPDAAAERPAVEVVLQRPQPGLILPLVRGIDNDGRQLRASGSAIAAPRAALEVGSFAARVAAGDSNLLNDVLGGLAGGDPEITLAGYQGLVNAQVPFTDVLPGDPEDRQTLLETPTELADFLQDLAAALVGTGQAAARAAVEALADAAAPGLTLVPGEIIGVVGDPADIGDDVFINAGNLANAAITAARQAVPVDLGLVQEIPGVARVEATATVLGPAVIQIGSDVLDALGGPSTVARSEQLALNTRVELLGLLGAPLLSFDVDTTGIRGEGEIRDIHCAGPGRPFHQVTVDARTTAVEVAVRNLQLDLSSLGLGVLALDDFVLDVSSATETPLVFGSATEPNFPQTKQAPAVSDSVSTAVVNGVVDAVTNGLPGVSFLLQPVLDLLVATALGPLLGGTLDPLLADLFATVGVEIAGADVSINSVSARRPYLFTHDG